MCWAIEEQCHYFAFSLPSTIILNTFSYKFQLQVFSYFSFFSVIYPKHNSFSPLCKILQTAKTYSWAAHPQSTSLWCYCNFPSHMFVYFLTCWNFEFLNQTHWHNYFYPILCTLLSMSTGSQSNVCFLSSW